MRKLHNILVTGGAGFIGSNFIHFLFDNPAFKGNVINVDKLTYAGNPDNVSSVKKKHGGKRYFFIREDICRGKKLMKIFKRFDIDTVVHFAAESHVDRSIYGPGEFIQTNIIGTFNLLEAARLNWGDRDDVLFHHVSTDEVYGSLGESGYFFENTPYDPHSPYSASKASSDHLVKSYWHTYGLPVTVSNCSNNYGPYQFPEKLIPLLILNMKDEKQLPVYGEGKNVRDWIHVYDHNRAVWEIMNNGRAGETYNIGGENEWKNIDIVHLLCEKMAMQTGKEAGYYKKLIKFVKDRPGHDVRYAINCDKIKAELGWRPGVDFGKGIEDTIRWYLDNDGWVDNVRSGRYRKWMMRNYVGR